MFFSPYWLWFLSVSTRGGNALTQELVGLYKALSIKKQVLIIEQQVLLIE